MSKPRYIAHYGGECPVGPETMVEVVFRDGDLSGSANAGFWAEDDGDRVKDWWQHKGNAPELDIIAYRIL